MMMPRNTLLLYLTIVVEIVASEHRNMTKRRLVKKKKWAVNDNNNDRVGYVHNEVGDYTFSVPVDTYSVEEESSSPIAGYHYHHLKSGQEQRQTDSMGFLDFLTGAKLTNALTLNLPIPFCRYTELCSTVDVILPFTVIQLFPANTGRSERKLEEEQEGLYKWAEDLLDRYGLPGKSCVLRAVCELAEAGGLQGHGLAGRAAQALLLMEYAEAEEGLVEYLGARAKGRSESGQCGPTYYCPASLSSMEAMAQMLGKVDFQAVASMVEALSAVTKP